jgi:hypothetical protein
VQEGVGNVACFVAEPIAGATLRRPRRDDLRPEGRRPESACQPGPAVSADAADAARQAERCSPRVGGRGLSGEPFGRSSARRGDCPGPRGAGVGARPYGGEAHQAPPRAPRVPVSATSAGGEIAPGRGGRGRLVMGQVRDEPRDGSASASRTGPRPHRPGGGVRDGPPEVSPDHRLGAAAGHRTADGPREAGGLPPSGPSRLARIPRRT